MSKGRRDARFITTALNVGAGLRNVLRRAEEISLEAMNAKTIVARAGERAHAIRPIADEGEALSRSIVALVNRISAQSLAITNTSIREFSEEVMVSYFERAHAIGGTATHIQSLTPATAAARNRLETVRKTVEAEARAMFRLLNDIDSTLLAANIVTSMFRIEASLSGSSHRAGFEALVQKFERAVADIRRFTHTSKRALTESLGQ